MTTPGFVWRRRGTDTSGRPIYMTDYAWAVHQAVLRHPLVAPFAHLVTIVQGAFMSKVPGGGADASAGYHDLGGCWDIRTWNLTTKQLDALIWVYRLHGVAAWRRDKSWLHGGMDPHLHATLGTDSPLSSGALQSWSGYLRGTNGLASGRADYERRPSPLVRTPPASTFEEDYMATTEAEQKLNEIREIAERTERKVDAAASADVKRWTAERERDREERKRQSERYRNLVSKVGGLVDQLPEEFRGLVTEILASEKDVTGADNPAPQEGA